MHLCTNAQSTHEFLLLRKTSPSLKSNVSQFQQSMRFNTSLITFGVRLENKHCLYLNRWCLDVSSASSSLPFSSDHKVEVDQACFHAKPQLVE